MADVIKPNYVMRKSAWCAIRPWEILVLLLSVGALVGSFMVPDPFNKVLLVAAGVAFLIPLLVIVFKVINLMDDTISIYYNKVVEKHGIFNTVEDTRIFTQVLAVKIKQNIWGKIFNYGTIYVDVVGQKWDFDMKGIKNPRKAKEFLESYAANGFGMQQFIVD